MGNKSVLTDVKTLRSQARQHIEEGAVLPPVIRPIEIPS